ncbi:galactose-3-O-sulfotransferase 2-like [Watersipora subatra]|uniref:galactose-3-O-sulfotransferase 2-like n=1 Tax=Watersipora subatra TaxID=2589382 RepID=UPI00355C1A43
MRPKVSGNHIGWPEPFDPQKHARDTSKSPDILCFHSVYSPKLAAFMANDTFFLTAVRDPFTQLVSTYVYSNWLICSRKPLSALISKAASNQYVCDTPLHNPTMFDLGYPMNAMSDLSRVDEYITMLDERFHLVIVVEYFDESLIVLRDMLNWKNHDILYFSKNIRLKNMTSLRYKNVTGGVGVDVSDTDDDRKQVYEVMQADSRLYFHFKRKLERTIADNKEYIEKEVAELKALRDQWTVYCIAAIKPAAQIKVDMFHPFGNGAFGYLLTNEGLKNETCINLARVELSFVTEINNKALSFYYIHWQHLY